MTKPNTLSSQGSKVPLESHKVINYGKWCWRLWFFKFEFLFSILYLGKQCCYNGKRYYQESVEWCIR